MKRWLPISILISLIIISFYPFLPGEYDSLSLPLAMMVQIFSGLGLLTCIPASIWIYFSMSNDESKNPKKLKVVFKFYVWTLSFVLAILSFFMFLGVSKLLGIGVFISSVFIIKFLLKNFSNVDFINSKFTAVFTFLLPIVLLVFQIMIDKPLTDWCKNTAIINSKPLIDEIERYKLKYDTYPLTINGGWKDYNTGFIGIEKYQYTYDDSTYNVYFEQPRFFFDNFGTREFVVYNPNDNYIILSHSSWNMLFTAEQRRNNQGWYSSHETGVKHWKYFWFD